ncbi:MAG: hypothetical protein DMF70_14880 [Acidobacteria bacterium]|nr:MAG: hypothetical protein DMF70_14880 [Acidobacteriota bacterium]
MPQSASKQFSGIFVCYRRDDSSGHAGRLFDKLVDHFGKERIFMDIDTIEPGEDFVTVIENAVGSCEILIAIIGRHWLSSTGESPGWLDNPNDFVRVEIATALSRDIRVIPVLVQRASMPKPHDLPDDLTRLSRRNAVELSDLRWQNDVEELIGVMERVLAKREEERRRAEQEEGEEEERRRDDAERTLQESLRVAQEERDREAVERQKNEAEEALIRAEEERVRVEVRRRTEEEAERRLVETEQAVPRLEDEKVFQAKGEHTRDEAEEAGRQRTVEQALPARHEEKQTKLGLLGTGIHTSIVSRWQKLAVIACIAVLVIVVIVALLSMPQPSKVKPESANQNATPKINPLTGQVTVALSTAAENAARGDELYKQQKYAEAESSYREAVRLAPSNAVYNNNLGDALYYQRKYSEAESQYREAIRLESNDSQYNNNLGAALREQKKYGDAEPYFREAVRLAPSNAGYNYNLGDALYDQQKYAEAEPRYREAVRLDPNNTTYQEKLNRVRQKIGP